MIRTAPTARGTALQVLHACHSGSAWADASLKALISRSQLSAQDGALASRIVYGVLQNQLLLDYYLSAYCTQKLDHLQSPLADILRIGAYQILFLEKVPDSAAVNESVELAKQAGRGQASGLVNAVLRALSRNKQQLPPLPDKDPLRRLSIQYSHPKWLVKRLVKLLGEEEAEAFLREDNQVAPMTIQVNPLKTTAEALTEELQAAGVSVRPHPWLSGCLELSGVGRLSQLEAFNRGDFLVQDAAAALVARVAAPTPGSRIIDACAAPGGKSFALAMAMGDSGEILSCDLHANKGKRIQEGAARLGLQCITTYTADGRQLRPEWVDSADLVVADVPCSGLGVIRKKPDIRYKKSDDLLMMPVIQSAILENVSAYVRPGGSLIYSTCTVLPEENEMVTDSFLAGHPDFSRESFSLPEPIGEVPGQITLWPQRNGTDGFYICRMRRKDNS
jgi:16S rRNA (cytosine967-C5)-methyltransferase